MQRIDIFKLIILNLGILDILFTLFAKEHAHHGLCIKNKEIVFITFPLTPFGTLTYVADINVQS